MNRYSHSYWSLCGKACAIAGGNLARTGIFGYDIDAERPCFHYKRCKMSPIWCNKCERSTPAEEGRKRKRQSKEAAEEAPVVPAKPKKKLFSEF